MTTNLVIVESPAKAKTINRYLGKDYVVRPTFGHLIDLEKSGPLNMGVSILNGFVPKYKTIPDKEDKLRSILTWVKKADNIYLATDPDREGEAIAFHIYKKIKTKTSVPIKRLEFKEITKTGIAKAFKEVRDLDQNLYDAQQARRVIDRIVGFMTYPFIKNELGKTFSAGRVQSVALRLVVEKEREIEMFNLKTYFTISAVFKEKLTCKIDRKLKEEEGKALEKQLNKATFKVTKIKQSQKNTPPPPPLTTPKLQQLSSSRFKLGVEKTMRIAQSLYERGLITYMRTDSVSSSPEAIGEVRKWLGKNNHSFPKKPNFFKQKNSLAQEGHEAIRPTSIICTSSTFQGTPEEKKVYGLIWETFVASQMSPAIFITSTVEVTSSTGEVLVAHGKIVKDLGWMAISKEKRPKDQKLPSLLQDQELKLDKLKREEHVTKPPPRFNEGSLVKALEEKGVGRPSTYGAIMKKLTKYSDKKRNVLSPKKQSFELVDLLEEHFSFMEVAYTKKMEEKLDKVSAGKLSYLEMMSEFFDGFRRELRHAYYTKYPYGGRDCEHCGLPMILRHGSYGFYISCSGFPDCQNMVSVRIDDDKIIEVGEHDIIEGVTCPRCDEGMIRKDGVWGPFYCCSSYPKCYGKRKMPSGITCTKCKQHDLYFTLFHGEPKLLCLGYPKCDHLEDLPTQFKTEWVDPSVWGVEEKNKVVEKFMFKPKLGKATFSS